jgi:hypothetical protein
MSSNSNPLGPQLLFIFAQEKMFTFYNLPEKVSPIVHSVGSTENEPGHCAIIFVDRPSPSTAAEGQADQPTQFASKLIQKNSAFVFTCPKNELFLPFNEIIEHAVRLDLDVYLALLKFFKDQWPRIDMKMTADVDSMRNQTKPVALHQQGLHFYQHGSCNFINHFNNQVTLHGSRESRDLSNRTLLKLETVGGKSVNLHPAVMVTLAQTAEPLTKLLTNVMGYGTIQ